MGFSSVAVWFGRYASAALAAWVVFVVEGVLLYAGLLVTAVASDADVGGPLGGLLVAALAAVLGLLLTGLVCAPAVALGEIVGRDRHWSVTPAAALGTAALLLALSVAVAAWITRLSTAEAVVTWLAALLAVTLPTIALATVAYGSGRLLARFAPSRPGAVPAEAGASNT